jgi:pyruvate formate lyase activating enzyme
MRDKQKAYILRWEPMPTEAAKSTLAHALAARTAEGRLFERLAHDWVLCVACGHRCKIPPGRAGICRVRENRAGTLYVPRGYVGALQVDPIEKKPFFHALPGSDALSFGMLGCDYHCGYCQNWLTSQALRDPSAVTPPSDVSAEELVDLALRHGARVVTSTYNEPLITSEWAVEVFRLAHARGLATSYVSNGNGTEEVLAYLGPWVDLYKVDLKGFDDARYRKLGGVLATVLAAIERLVAMRIWVEVVTLIVPGWNDSDAELRGIARFLAGVSPDIPWHVTAFHDDYRMRERGRTPEATLVRAAAIGRDAGLRFVYAGNLPGCVGDLENTVCPGCGALLVERCGFHVRRDRVVRRGAAGACPDCARAIPGVWAPPR